MTINDQPEQERAGGSWVVVGLLFGLLGWLVALATDKGDGRANKALTGCLLWMIPVIAFIFVALGSGA